MQGEKSGNWPHFSENRDLIRRGRLSPYSRGGNSFLSIDTKLAERLFSLLPSMLLLILQAGHRHDVDPILAPIGIRACGRKYH